MKFSPTLSFLLLSALGVISCQGPSTSELKRNAKANDASVKVIRVRDGDLIRFVMASNGKGYELSCENPLGLLNLIDATGFPSSLVNSYPALDIDNEAVSKLKFKEQPQLNCNAQSTGQILYKIDLDNTTKYFFSANQSSTNLFMFGCQALVDAMGFDLKTANPLPAYLVDVNHIFNVNDDKDINCLKGVSIGSKVSWESGTDQSVFVKPGIELNPQTYTAKNPDGTYATLDMKVEGACEWVQSQKVLSALLVRGTVPTSFRGQQCTVTVTAAAGTLGEDKKTLKIATCGEDSILGSKGQCQTIATKWGTSSSLSGLGTFNSLSDLSFADEKNGWVVAQVGVDSAVYNTVDGGLTWLEQKRFAAAALNHVAFASARVGWVVGDSGLIYKTNDGGKTWGTQASNVDGNLYQVRTFDENRAWIKSSGYILRTQDGGKTWEKSILGAPGMSVTTLSFADALNGYAVIWGNSKTQVWSTEDGGAHWALSSDVSSFQGFSVDLFVVNANTVWLTRGNGIYRSTNAGQNWTTMTNPDIGSAYYGIRFLDEKIGWVLGNNGLFLTKDGGKNWSKQSVTGEFYSLTALDASHIWHVTPNGNVAYTLPE